MRIALLIALTAAFAIAGPTPAADAPRAHDLARLERSFWLNLSLASPGRGYWGPQYPAADPPAESAIARAAKILCEDAAANRLYLIHHGEFPPPVAREVFLRWRSACPPEVELVPTFVLRMYDKAGTPVFDTPELNSWCEFVKSALHARRIAIYDVTAGRDHGAATAFLAGHFPDGILRVGLQPDEPLPAPFAGAVEDTWSALCHGRSNADWQSPGFGETTLKRWIGIRNAGDKPVAWDLIVVAWDYSVTKRGEYPGYDDAAKNLPLPPERNLLATRDILSAAMPGKLAGFSSDLLILQLNSASEAHDGPRDSFYRSLMDGKTYDGFYARPWREILSIYRSLRAGSPP